MKIKRKIMGAALALSIAIGSIPITESALKAMEDGGGNLMIMPGVSALTSQGTTDNYEYIAGSAVYYGRYPQSKYELTGGQTEPNEGEEDVDWVKKTKDNVNYYYNIDPIEWRVLTKENELFLMSDKNLDYVKFYEKEDFDTQNAYPWSSSTIRSWLNGYDDYTADNFKDSAFTEEEATVIATTEIKRPSNPHFESIVIGEKTQDQIFLLSIQEAINEEYGFKENNPNSNTWYDRTKTHIAKNTQYIQDGWGRTGYPAGSAGRWWLRSPGDLK